ncbi:hypothetical protein PILCRDRAFT_90818 [Piloderma croceum F 1598]|uniref:Uncharacterized protein n=1 Tax=Piloderma croceum (strain F 1598) TaxID=765440 RepID=A0A0C3FDS7_PILCF|nr:hypothetical protein PILCRDRAFT_90818 [Piloderma croceum F 1598]
MMMPTTKLEMAALLHVYTYIGPSTPTLFENMPHEKNDNTDDNVKQEPKARSKDDILIVQNSNTCRPGKITAVFDALQLKRRHLVCADCGTVILSVGGCGKTWILEGLLPCMSLILLWTSVKASGAMGMKKLIRLASLFIFVAGVGTEDAATLVRSAMTSNIQFPNVTGRMAGRVRYLCFRFTVIGFLSSSSSSTAVEVAPAREGSSLHHHTFPVFNICFTLRTEPHNRTETHWSTSIHPFQNIHKIPRLNLLKIYRLSRICAMVGLPELEELTTKAEKDELLVAIKHAPKDGDNVACSDFAVPDEFCAELEALNGHRHGDKLGSDTSCDPHGVELI